MVRLMASLLQVVTCTILRVAFPAPAPLNARHGFNSLPSLFSPCMCFFLSSSAILAFKCASSASVDSFGGSCNPAKLESSSGDSSADAPRVRTARLAPYAEPPIPPIIPPMTTPTSIPIKLARSQGSNARLPGVKAHAITGPTNDPIRMPSTAPIRPPRQPPPIAFAGSLDMSRIPDSHYAALPYST